MSSPNNTSTLKPLTGAEAGLSGDEQVRLALREIASRGGCAQMSEIYDAVNATLKPKGFVLSKQGRDSLRFFVNKVAVKAGYVYPFDKKSPGWRLTSQGREVAEHQGDNAEAAINTDTGAEESVPSQSARGDAFEQYFLIYLRAAYPNYAWYHQGRDKRHERGVDFVGNRIGDSRGEHRSIGVQVKFHSPNIAPNEREWLKFLAGCFARRLDAAIFATTGKLTSEQRREAQEARVIVIEGREEITRLAAQHGIERFELFEDQAVAAPS
jgi:Restriction endonuclease